MNKHHRLRHNRGYLPIRWNDVLGSKQRVYETGIQTYVTGIFQCPVFQTYQSIPFHKLILPAAVAQR